jgi:hypothetical protein
MKKYAFFTFFLIGACFRMYAQTGTQDYSSGFKAYLNAKKLLEETPKNKDTVYKAMEILNAAIDYFNKAKNENSELTEFCNYRIYHCYVAQYRGMDNILTLRERFSYLEKALNLWPDINSFSKSKLTNNTNFVENGKSMTMHPYKDDDFDQDFYLPRVYATSYYFTIKYNDDALKYALTCIKNTSSNRVINLIGSYYAIRVFEFRKEPCMAGRYAYMLINDAKNIEYSDGLRIFMDTILASLDNALAAQCFSKDTLTQIALLLPTIDKKWGDQSIRRYKFGIAAYNMGNHSLAFMIIMLKTASLANNELEKAIWQQAIDDNIKTYNNSELQSLIDYYQSTGDQAHLNQMKHALENLERRQNSHVLVSTNPFMILGREYILAVDFIGPKLSHSFRFNYKKNAAQFLLAGSGDSVGSLPIYRSVKGFQLSYNLRFLHKNQNGKISYMGPEFRYSNFQYTDSILILNRTIKSDFGARNINAKGSDYELTWNFGYYGIIKKVYFDFYCGLGLGYRSLTTNINPEIYKILDYRYTPDHWNRMYFVPRAGWRFGIVF